jgi:CheY-like chemotaxis protein
VEEAQGCLSSAAALGFCSGTAAKGRRVSTVLLIDDDEAFAYATSRVIRGAGHRVITFTDSRKALRILETVQDFDVVVTDVVMPDGHPNGFAIAQMARSRNPDLKVVYISGYELLSKDLTAGEKVLLKPFSPGALVVEIESRFRAS